MKTKAAQIFENSVMLSIDKLIPYERNAKIHPESQIETLAKIFIELGFDQPIVLDPNYVIIKGHGRRLAAIRAGFTEVPCIIRYDLSASQVRATRIADNVIAKTDWDHENLVSDLKILEQEDADLLDIIGYQEDELKELLHNKRDDQGERNDTYTNKIQTPIYEPKGPKPKISELFDLSKAERLIEEIDCSDIPDNEKIFLRYAAYRHIVFNYQNIAEYYAHSDAEFQNSAEQSALVVIDFEKAIENGFVALSHDLAEAYKNG